MNMVSNNKTLKMEKIKIKITLNKAPTNISSRNILVLIYIFLILNESCIVFFISKINQLLF
jgi:hypothetical protein